jgi:hypothetical protein
MPGKVGMKPSTWNIAPSDVTTTDQELCTAPVRLSHPRVVRVYAKQTEVHTDSNLFKRTNPLSGFENSFLDHLEKTGMESIVYIDVPGQAEMINVIIKHSSSTTTDQPS